MKAKHVTLAILIIACLALVLPPATGLVATASRRLLGETGPVQVPLEPGAAQTDNRAALIVQFDAGSYITRCVSFAEDNIAGLDLLARSGLQVALWGGAVCRIQDQGCDYPAQPCFCQCKGSSCQYWSYWHWRDNRWTYSQIGSGDYRVHHGDVEAWLWGDAQTPPVTVSFTEICGPSQVATPAVSGTPASTQSSNQRISLVQYAIFLIMATALVAGFWFRRRHGS